jgi:hypothetical protein
MLVVSQQHTTKVKKSSSIATEKKLYLGQLSVFLELICVSLGWDKIKNDLCFIVIFSLPGAMPAAAFKPSILVI